MRRIALAFAFIVGASTASSAADPAGVLRGAVMDVTRGPTVDWNGYYFGGHFATGTSDIDFRHGMNLLAGANPLGKESSSGSGFGGFVGYNAQWDQAALLGFEINYTRGDFGAHKTVTNGTVVTFGEVDLKDLVSARLRAGWTTGIFMPYAFGGASYGIADLTRTVTTSGVLTNSIFQNRHSVYGFNAGAGLEMMVFGSGFVRAEFEYTRFSNPIDTSVTTGRLGAGIKF
jgi:opacity protein-like surface antigen